MGLNSPRNVEKIFTRSLSLIVDPHVQYRLGTVDAFQLANALLQILNTLVHLRAYNYKLMQQA